MEENQYIYPTIKSRIIFGILIFFAIFAYFYIEPAILSLIPSQSESDTIKEIQSQTKQINSISLTVSIIMVLFCCVFSIFFIYFGKKIIKNDQFPIEGIPVIIKTKIVSGGLAQLQGIGWCIVGILFLGFSLFWIYLIWLIIQ